MRVPHGTAELYDFECQVLHATIWYEQEHQFDLMHTMLSGIWVQEHGDLSTCPKLVKKENPLVTYQGTTTSYYDPDTHSIALIEGQRNLVVLVHEVAHAMGCYNHDWRFRKLYFRLLDNYVGIKRSWLEQHYKAWTTFQRKNK